MTHGRRHQPTAKARERSEQERGGGRGATSGSVLEGGSEGKGRPPAGWPEIVCGSGAGRGGAYRTLHYAAAMVRLYADGRYKASIPIWGVAA